MSKREEKEPSRSEFKVKGTLVEKGVKISEKQNINELSSRGYGVKENDELLLTFYEALYLLDKGWLDVEAKKGKKMDFQQLLRCYEDLEENAWVKYLTYRDLRSRGYTVREGFGLGVDFRVYEKGEYGKNTAKYLILSIQEGKPIPIEDLTRIMLQCQSLKKELVLAVMNRRGEIVYYSVSQLTLK
ncbi:MAG: tRNA-intron lyase [Candidatus Bathyarchaeota archaeon]|jgi:tRNA-intron endonuclease|nr:tRNA-intron lyase [Candidatus Bathyarchaeota archaeon A05DMB-5]MDH7557741.1 tRNA-intron lyase [Candidatus Bathyarchaeota archaeon]